MSALDRMMGGLLGAPQNYGGLLSSDDENVAKRDGQMALAAQLLAAGGYSDKPVSLGQSLGAGIMAGRNAQAQSSDSQLQAMLLKAQIAKANKPDTENMPNSVKEYEYASKNGFKGTYQDWITAGGQSSRPSSVQEWEFYNGLIKEDADKGTNRAQQYLEMKRNPNFFVKDVNGAPTVINPTVAGGTKVSPLSTLDQTASAAEELKRRENRGGAIGTGQGTTQAGINKKGSDAVGTDVTIDMADGLIDKATGSAGGALYDQGVRVFGGATEGDKANAQLQILQTNLMMNQPRMEGPQGEKDVALYEKAAAQLGDPTIPRDIKKAALQTIRSLNERYKERAGITDAPSKSAVVRKKYNPETGKIE